MKLRRTAPFLCAIEREGAMRVPGKVYLSPALEHALDDGSLHQVANVASLPGIVGASIAMPDIHIGYGFPIGGVAAFDAETGIVSPGGIGFDINCGVRLLRTDLQEAQVRPLTGELLTLLGKAVPTGTGRNSAIRLTHEQLDDVLREGSGWALRNGYATGDDVERTEERGCLAGADPRAVGRFAKDRGVNQLGTLGAGNHFLEVQAVDRTLDERRASAFGLAPGQVVILIHCGSRGLGHQVCTDYVRSMEDAFPKEAAALPERNLMYAPLGSELAQRYLAAMAAAANFAWCNRQVIAHAVRKTFERLFPGCSVTQVYDVSHNIAKLETYAVDGSERALWVHRKGATRSFAPGRPEIPAAYREHGQPVLIPGSMGTASWVLAGTEAAMRETFGSCCHGAGRRMSRTQALQTIKGGAVRSALRHAGIAVQAPGKGLAEEAPEAYKDVDEVIRVVAEAGLAVPVARLVPMAVLKG